MINMSNKEELGLLGEKLVSKILGGTLSEDKYDMEKDLVLRDGTNVEVKTQPRWKMANCFTIDETHTENNIHKCLNVDRLFFVEPGLNDAIRVFECTDRSYSIRSPRGKRTYCFDIDNMTLVKTIHNKEICDRMISLSKTPLRWLS